MFLAIILFGLFASIFSLSKETLEFAEAFFIIGSRMFAAGILLTSYQYIFNRKNFKIDKKDLGSFFLLAILGIYITNVAEIWGIEHMQSAKACLIYSLSPFLAALIAYFVLGEKLTAKKGLGMVIGFIGLIPIIYTQTDVELSAGAITIFSYAELSVLIAVVASVLGWILLKKLVSEKNYSPILVNGITMTIGGMLALGHSYLRGENWSPVPVTEMLPFVRNTFLMFMISNVVCYNLYGFLLKRYSATFMSFAGLVTPLFASLFGWVYLDEPVSWHFYASVGIFSIGLGIFNQEEMVKDKFKPAAETA